MSLTLKHALFADRYELPPEIGYVLPALFEHAAKGIDVSPSYLLQQAISNTQVGEYMASLAREVDEKCRTEKNNVSVDQAAEDSGERRQIGGDKG
jgi:hypothetical protein